MARHLLVLKTAAVGDCLNALPAVRAVRRALPATRVSWLVGRAAAGAVIGQADGVDWIVVDDARLVRPRPGAILSLALGLRRRGIDAALVLHRAKAVRLFAAVSGARRRVGLVRTPEDRTLLTEAVVDPPGVPEGQRYWLAAERLVGRPLTRDTWRWSPPAEAQARASTLWAAWGWGEDERVIALAPGGGVNPRTRFDLKRWPMGRYADLARRLAARAGHRVLVVGLPDEVRAFRESLGAWSGVETASGDLRLAGALLARARVCVANDGGLMHLAAAVGVPTVAVFGPTDPAVWGPWGPGHRVARHVVPCQPCYKDDGVVPRCPWEHRCMRDLETEVVLGTVDEVLRGA